jgi:hypothetical protein
MISQYTLKFSPAVSQKELAKRFAAGESFTPEELAKLRQMKARIEVVCDFGDLKKVDDFLKQFTG